MEGRRKNSRFWGKLTLTELWIYLKIRMVITHLIPVRAISSGLSFCLGRVLPRPLGFRGKIWYDKGNRRAAGHLARPRAITFTGKGEKHMDYTFGWRNYRLTDTCCGSETDETLWYDLNGRFNVCSMEVIETVKEFERVKRRSIFRKTTRTDAIVRYYLKVGYLSDDGSGKVRHQLVEIRPEEAEDARQACAAVRQKIAQKHAPALHAGEQAD